jgi:hypothetical protein
MTRLIVPCLLASLGLMACSGPLVQKAATSFHEGYTNSAKTLANRQAALVNFERAKLTFPRMVQSIPMPNKEQAADFAQYACAQPTGLADVAAGMQALNAVDRVVSAATTVPAKNIPDLVKGLISDFGKTPAIAPPVPQQSEPQVKVCVARVTAYVMLIPGDLPDLSLAGLSPAPGAFPAALGAALVLLKVTVEAITTVLTVAEEEARAAKLKKFVADAHTQDTVQKAFATIRAGHQPTTQFCEMHQDLCRGETPGLTQADSLPQPKTAPPSILDGITIGQRWAALWRAWLRYYDYINIPKAAAFSVDGFSKIEADRRQALDQAVEDYMNIPSVSDIIDAQEAAWSKLSDLANDKITPEEAFGALSAFADRAQQIFDAAKKVSDAKDTLDKALAPPGK